MFHVKPEAIPDMLKMDRKVYKKHLYDLAKMLTPAEISEIKAKREAERIENENDTSWMTEDLPDWRLDAEFMESCK